jgi:hypothetical protein
MKTYWGVEVELHTFLTSAGDGGEWSVSRPDRPTSGETANGTHWIEERLRPRASLDAVEESVTILIWKESGKEELKHDSAGTTIRQSNPTGQKPLRS